MTAVFRALGAIVAASGVAFILVVAIELLSAVAHPLPADFSGTKAEMCQHIERCPSWVLAAVVPAWAATTLASAWIAGRLGNRGCGLLVGLLLLAAVVFNMSMLPYPTWFEIANLLAMPSAIAAAIYLSRHHTPAPSG